MKPAKQLLIVKSNRLIEAIYRLDLMEQRLILAAIVVARESQRGLVDDCLTIEAGQFANIYNLNVKVAYEQLKEARTRIYSRSLIIQDADPETGNHRIREMNWIAEARYMNGAGAIQLRFSPEIVPFITRLDKEFTSYPLEKIGQMTSVHAIRMYEMLVQYMAVGKREIAIADLRKMLQLEADYPRIFDLKKYVLDVGVTQINKLSDLSVSYTQRKTGRNVTHLLFTIKSKDAKTALPRKQTTPPKKEPQSMPDPWEKIRTTSDFCALGVQDMVLLMNKDTELAWDEFLDANPDADVASRKEKAANLLSPQFAQAQARHAKNGFELNRKNYAESMDDDGI